MKKETTIAFNDKMFSYSLKYWLRQSRKDDSEGLSSGRQIGSERLGYGATPCWHRVRENLLHHQGANATPGWGQKVPSSAVLMLRYWLLFMLFVTWLTACETVLPSKDTGSFTPHLIHVVSNGWHTAIVIPAPALFATGTLPEAADFSDAPFLEFGWGDRIYYPAKKKTLGRTLSAALIATPAVMHMAALQVPPKDDGSGLKMISVELTEAGFLRLVQALAAEFERPTGGRAKPVSRGLYSDSHFYRAHGKFHLFNTCNTWTARMLRASGVAISSSGIMTADRLMTRLKEALPVE